MTVMEAARQLGVCIQADERYLAYRDATLAVEKDEQVKALGENLDELQKQYEAEAVKETPDEKAMSDLQLLIVDRLPILGLGFRTGSLMSNRSLYGMAGNRLYDAYNGLEFLQP